jgi:hypothetical protein
MTHIMVVHVLFLNGFSPNLLETYYNKCVSVRVVNRILFKYAGNILQLQITTISIGYVLLIFTHRIKAFTYLWTDYLQIC